MIKGKGIPYGWERKSLRDLATINYGKSPAKILAVDGTYPVVGTGGTERLGNDYLYEGNSIILGRKGTIDRVHFVTGRFWTIDTAYYLSDFTESLPFWLFYFLQTIDLRQLNEATGVPSLSRDLLYKMEIQVPPIPEQTKIAEILSMVDRAIEQTEAMIAKQQRIIAGLMQDLLTCGIDEFGNIRTEQTHQFKDSPLGRIPVEWEVKKLSELVDESITYGIVQAGEHIEDGIPYIRTGDMAGESIKVDKLLRTSKKIANSYKRSTVFFGDIVFALRATVGKVLSVSKELEGANLTQGTAKISPKDSIEPMFLLWALRTEKVQTQIRLHQKGTTFMEITLNDLRSIEVPIPMGRDEQMLISKKLNMQNKLRLDYIQSLRKLRSLKSSLIKDLLTGKKRVNALLNETGVTV